MSRLEWILGIVLLILVAVVGLFAYQLWLQPNRATTAEGLPTAVPTLAVLPTVTLPAAPTSVFAGETAKTAFEAALGVAQQWQPDAALVTATATWPQGVTVDTLQTGSSTWGFTFYAPNAVETAVVTVVDNEAQFVTASAYNQPEPPQVVPVQAWLLDSHDAVIAFLESGGAGFIEEVDTATLAMALGAQTENGRLDWSMTLLAPGNGRSLFMRFDANTGEKLEEVAAP